MTQIVTYPNCGCIVSVRCYSAASIAWLLAAHPSASVRGWTAADAELYGLPLQSSTSPLQTEPVAATGPAPAGWGALRD